MILAPLHLNAVPTPGALLGTTGTNELIDTINNGLGMASNFFGSIHDVFSKGRQLFIQNNIEPIRQIGRTLKQAANKLLRNDVIYAMVEEKDYQYVPPSMQLPILLYEPIRQLHKQGRVHGFGYDPMSLPEEDAYGRLINNGSADLHTDVNKDGEFDLKWVWCTEDPDLSFEELDYIEQTRYYLDEIISQKKFDPTDYPEPLS
jgi:hypothetical protein